MTTTTYKTTEDVFQAANKLYNEAAAVTDHATHAAWWDKKVDLLRIANTSLETGYFTGAALADLQDAKRIIFRAESVAGDAALKCIAARERRRKAAALRA